METVGQLRKAVVFHLYYHELWEKIKPYLLNLQEIGAFDLYITTPVENKELFNSIKQSFSCAVNIYIYILLKTRELIYTRFLKCSIPLIWNSMIFFIKFIRNGMLNNEEKSME